jgi:hypothetical protein
MPGEDKSHSDTTRNGQRTHEWLNIYSTNKSAFNIRVISMKHEMERIYQIPEILFAITLI